MTKKKKKCNKQNSTGRFIVIFVVVVFFSHNWIFQQISYMLLYCIISSFKVFVYYRGLIHIVLRTKNLLFLWPNAFHFCITVWLHFFFFLTKITININHKYMMTLDSFFFVCPSVSSKIKNQLTKLTFRISFGISSLWMKTKKNW